MCGVRSWDWLVVQLRDACTPCEKVHSYRDQGFGSVQLARPALAPKLVQHHDLVKESQYRRSFSICQ